MKNSIFSDIAPYSLLKINPSFGGTYRFNLQALRVGMLVSCLTYSSTPEMEFFITAAVRTSYPREIMLRIVYETYTLMVETCVFKGQVILYHILRLNFA
jgi:hypothetical protein